MVENKTVGQEIQNHYPEMFRRNCSFEDMRGKTLVGIEVCSDEIKFMTDDGLVFKQLHYQDCCESVYIESIVGDLEDLIGNPLLLVEEVITLSDYRVCDSCTHTFYKLATRKGYVDIRWIGESNGYYSEAVEMEVRGVVSRESKCV